MTERERVALAVLLLAGLVVIIASARAEPVGVVTLDPIEPVGPIGNTDPLGGARDWLCDCAPLNSFGPACEGKNWIQIPAFGLGLSLPTELRTRIPAECGRS